MRRIWAVAPLLILVVACSDPATSSTTVAPPGPATTGPTSSSTTPSEDALDARLAWFTGVLDSGTLSEDEYQASFTAEFINNVPYDDMVGVIGQVAGSGTNWQVSEFEERDGLDAVVILAPAQGDAALRASISLEIQAPYRIQGLFLQPAETPSLDDPPADFAAAADRLAAIGDTGLLVAEINDGVCSPLFELEADRPVPVASAIKLYVLAAVADAVAAGDLSWSDDVEIRDDLKSVPTGVMQDEEAGTTFSVREMAEVMIAFSDNTATDHLIDLVGREAVETALTTYGMAQPELNVPFMNTLELTALKVGPASGLATQWLDADPEGRRAILDQISDITPADIPVSEFVDPVLPDQIEWFATPEDMCGVLVALMEMGDPIDKILTINPGLPDDEEAFETVAFKGGSEPGLTAMNWLVERVDGRRFVVAGSVVNPDEAIDALETTLLFGAVRDLVAAIP